jgi:hypothetical protein
VLDLERGFVVERHLTPIVREFTIGVELDAIKNEPESTMALMVSRSMLAAAAVTVIVLAIAAFAGRDRSQRELRDYLLRESDIGGEWAERFDIWEPPNVRRQCGEDGVVEHASITFDRESEGRLIAHALTVWQDGQCVWDTLRRTEAGQFEPATARRLSEVGETSGAESMAWRIEEPDRGTVYDLILARRGDVTSATWNEARTAVDLHETLSLAESASKRLESAEQQFKEVD